MRILHVIVRLAEVDGGPPRGLINLAKAQASLGEQVTILPCSSSGGRMLVEPGTYGNLTILKPTADNRLMIPSHRLDQILRSLAKEAEIVHIHGSWRYHLISASKASRRTGTAYIVRPAGNLGRIPRNHKNYIKLLYFKLIEKSYFQKAQALHCTTNKELHELSDMKLSPRSFVLPMPIDDSLTELETPSDCIEQMCPGLEPDGPLLVYLGRIARIKRLHLLTDAFVTISDQFRNSHLVLAGPWEDQDVAENIKATVNKANLVNC
ncbi:MAG: glycosyltransferase [Planctomycetota bacterium]|jgi:glycosyltransferase involved in cell wall biosynthesis